MNLNWHVITDKKDQYLKQAFALYDAAFPVEVREDHKVLLDSLDNNGHPDDFCFLTGLSDDKVVTFATAHYLADINSGFIVYIVTDPGIRGNGTGKETIRKIEEILNQKAIRNGHSGLDAMLLETEREEEAGSQQEREECQKRERFFHRNGFLKQGDRLYLQPPLHGEKKGVPLHLYVKNSSTRGLGKNKIEQAIFTIYKDKYLAVNRISTASLNGCLEEMSVGKEYRFS